MPNIKSAIKRVKVNEKKNLRNRMVRSQVKTSMKKLDVAVAAGSDNVNELYRVTTATIDKAVSKGVMHKNAANRQKARLAKNLVNVSQ